ncbi:hypothetical protein [Coxiella-like endosymbiont]|uniref:hypothetical protein n=1 Tax=Coxiella-like endosymbiont TaxID=1592897 RepID=UPI00272D3421|nr:hypothetical protein [Coxiella-like endosymbiont]
MIGWLGTNVLAASQVTQQCMFLFVVPMFAIAQRRLELWSVKLSGRVYQIVKRIGEGCLIISTLLTLVISAVFLIFPNFFRVTLLEGHYS